MIIEIMLKFISLYEIDYYLIDKQYYLNLIKDFKENSTIYDDYIFVYQIGNHKYIINLMNIAKKKFKLEINYFRLNNASSIKTFLYYLINSKAVITNSYHGTIFSIIFNKPFLTIYKRGAKNRLNTLSYLFNISKRILTFGQKPNYDLLIQPLDINYRLLNQHKQKSINFLEKNLKKNIFNIIY